MNLIHAHLTLSSQKIQFCIPDNDRSNNLHSIIQENCINLF
ncbi:hypothetical protein MtrunA17_Chr3g0121621 [Medicago truncatula]|uniref:Uncharacterized protein n=1 Tax=Medicago truncatula TaxID=3880 RepID=A0A396IUC8_MEDTR|nr:hypothetical protein MtrunA17_Chr3g0121621 [Medicago truncatula]